MTAEKADTRSVWTSIRSYITIHTGDFSLSDDADLFDLGLANSLFAMELITFIEREFRLTVTVEDLSINNFRSIGACCEFVEQRRSR